MKMNLITFNCKIFTNNKKHINIKLMYNQNIYCSLLEILKKHHIPIHYQCQSGYCGSCKIFLISGKIKYHKEPLISYIQSNEILSCCCYPITNIILKL